MMQRLYRDERGDLSYFTIFVILAVNMLLAFVLLFAMVKINSINIRNAAKMELNNVSARIYADTFHSQREANLESYMKDLHLSHSYQEALRADFINSLKDWIDMENDNYTLRNIRLDFNQYDDKIEYVFYCEAQFKIHMFGRAFPPVTQRIELTGSHHTKY